MKLRKLLYIIVATFAIIVVSCRESGMNQQLDMAEAVMSEHPDSALAILNRIDKSTISSENQKGRYALLKSIALDKNYIDTTNFDVLRPAIDYYMENGSPDEKLKTLYYQGRIYQNKEDKDSAMLCFLRAGDFSYLATDTLAVANLYVAQATILFQTYKFEDFIHKNLDAARLYLSVGNNEYAILSFFNALDGGILTHNKTLSDSILNELRPYAENNEELKTRLNPYWLSYTIRFGDKEEIKGLLESFPFNDNADDDFKLSITDAYCEINDVYNATRWFNSISEDSPTIATLRYKAIKPAVLEQNGDLKGALDAFRSFQIEIDSIHQNIFTHDLLFAQQRHEMEKANLAKIHSRDKLIWLIICILLCLVAGCLFFIYRYRLKKTKSLLLEKENNNLRLERDRQDLALENLRIKYDNLETEKERLDNILEENKDLAQPVQEAIKVRSEMLNSLLASYITGNESYSATYEQWRNKIAQDKEDFMNKTRLAFKSSHPCFIGFLEQHGLTDDEINYACLYAIGLRGKEVGAYIELKRHYHISSDIRRKLGLEEHHTNLGIYIRKLLKQS